MIHPEDVHEFLAHRRIAIVGASDEKDNFGNTVYTEMRTRGYEVRAVHPTATSVAGDPCYPDLASIPGDVDGVIVMVPAAAAADVARAAVARGVERIWLFKGAGAGSLSAEAVDVCQAAGAQVIEGACPLMFLEPTAFVHRAHRWMRRLNGSVAKAA